MEFQSLAKQALPLHNPVLNTGVVAELARLIYCMEFQSSPSPNFLSPRGERGTHEVGRGEGANLCFVFIL